MVHIGFQHVQWFIRTERLKVQGNYKAVANCEKTKCAACEFINIHYRSNKVNTTENNPMKEQELKKDHLMPVHMVSVDHYISWDIDRIYHTKAKSYPSDMFSGGFVFIYHVSAYGSMKNQVAMSATETFN